MREWVFVSWHLGGMAYRDYLELTMPERDALIEALKDMSFVKLRPERVLEVRYDQMEGHRFRHVAQFERWRPDRDPESCTYDQLDIPAAYDFGEVLR